MSVELIIAISAAIVSLSTAFGFTVKGKREKKTAELEAESLSEQLRNEKINNGIDVVAKVKTMTFEFTEEYKKQLIESRTELKVLKKEFDALSVEVRELKKDREDLDIALDYISDLTHKLELFLDKDMLSQLPAKPYAVTRRMRQKK